MTDQISRGPNLKSNQFLSMVKRIFLTFCILYAVAVGLLLIFENTLIFPGASASRGNYDPTFEYEDVNFEASDGTKLHGWMIPYANDPTTDRYVLYCHGNAENVTSANQGVPRVMADAMKANLFIFDYRGYGKSEGKPNEAGLKLDTDAAMDWLCQRFNIQPSDVIVDGFSVGGGPAVYMGTKRGAKGLVLQRTFSSLPDVAAVKHPWAPVRLLMQNRFDSAALLEEYHGPLLQAHGEKDQVVPYKFGQKLYAACPSEDKAFFSRPEMDHFSPVYPEFLKMAADFADRLYEK